MFFYSYLCSLGIEFLRFILGPFSLVPRNLGPVDAIFLLLNRLGGVFGLLREKFALKNTSSYKYTMEVFLVKMKYTKCTEDVEYGDDYRQRLLLLAYRQNKENQGVFSKICA
ncbi:hypothetical protein I6G82_20500 [Lysinibacillus macroides]|uniref:hypothetical protein n=1 Tax=Lysinibacillus macroides TaxID=33935 RepID=UPI000AC1B84D|nr:hypothetical protein [Lysinibacillus macroides]QPR67555.1 hypothetical protein I6G82_20500 [Lysinibacillus macroides]